MARLITQLCTLVRRQEARACEYERTRMEEAERRVSHVDSVEGRREPQVVAQQ